jgi:acetylglutamate kinase
MKDKLTIVKVGGKIVEDAESLSNLLNDFSQLSGYKVLVHGGGRSATRIATRLGIETKMINGRRITDEDMLQVVTMVYGGLVNKNVVAKLQGLGLNAIGLTGADMDVIRSDKRPVREIDYGFAGDVKSVNGEILAMLIKKNIIPVMAPLTHDGMGHMLNTNADTIAAEIAKSLAKYFDVTLTYCFDRKGVLRDENDENSVINLIDPVIYKKLKEDGVVCGGMFPKMDNAFSAINAGVSQVIITSSEDLSGKYATVIKNK